MSELSAQTVSSLESAGWEPNRRIAASRFVAAYERVGYPIFPIVISFLEEFGDLQLHYPHFRKKDFTDSCNFRAEIAARIEPPWIQKYEEHIGEKLVPIGTSSREHMDLLMTESGSIYASYEGLMCFVGANYTTALNALCEGHELSCAEIDDEKPAEVSSGGTDQVKDRLLAAGWESERSVPVTTKSISFDGLETELSSFAERFLREFDKLRVKTEPGGEFDVNPAIVSLDANQIREICARLGSRSLTPIGMSQPGAILVVMDDKGCMYGTMREIPDWLVKYGNDSSTSLSAIVLGVGAVTI